MQEADDGADELGLGDAVQDKVLVDAETAHLGVRLLRLRARAVEVGMVDAVRAERWKHREIRLVLEEEAEVAKRLAGRVSRRKVVAEDAVEDERVAFRSVAMLDGRREGLVIDELDVRAGDKNVVSLLLLQVLVGRLGHSRLRLALHRRLAVLRRPARPIDDEEAADPPVRRANPAR